MKKYVNCILLVLLILFIGAYKEDKSISTINFNGGKSGQDFYKNQPSEESKSEEREDKEYKRLKYWLKQNYGLDIRNYTKKHITKRAVLMVQQNYLSDQDIQSIGKYIDQGIEKIEDYLGTTYYKEWQIGNNTEKITYFLGYGIISRVALNIDGKPTVFLNDAGGGKNALYLHETVHAVSNCWSSQTTWISEGLAVYLNGRLSEYKLWPEYGRDLHKEAKLYLSGSYKRTLDIIGQDGWRNIDPTTDDGKAYYVLSGSFVKYLIEKLGIKNFMEIYRHRHPSTIFKKETGKKLGEWKNGWLKLLGSADSYLYGQ